MSRERLIPEQELVLRWKEKGREADVRVVGEIAQTGHLYTYGVAFLDEGLDFREMEFPMAPDLPERPATLLLECAGCRGLAELSNGDFEFDICMIHGGLTRYCDYCGMMTVWKQSHEAMPLGRRVVTGKKTPPVEMGGRASGSNVTVTPVPAAARTAFTEKRATEEMQETILPIAEPAAKKEVERRSRVRGR